MTTHRFLLTLIVVLATAALGRTQADPAPQALDPATLVGSPRGQALEGEALEARTAEVAALLRCPVCQGLSVADSPASMALNMRSEVKALLAKGYDQEQILSYFEKSYGEFVRLRPPLRGMNWLVWLAPVAALIGGGLWVRRILRRGGAEPATKSATATSPESDDALLPYLRRVRELAYGWPNGLPPSPKGQSDE